MLDIFSYTDIVEADVRVLNPLSLDKLMSLGELAGLTPGATILDLACGKGEMLCQFARRHDISGVGVDIHQPFINAATQRAIQLGVSPRVAFRVADGRAHGEPGRFDVVSCLGGTWIGGDFAGCLELMRASLMPGGALLVGEPFAEQPSLRPPGDATATLADLLSAIEEAGFDLVDFVAASRDDWDRYSARHWSASRAWLNANTSPDIASELEAWTARNRHRYLTLDRTWLGWGVFTLRDIAS